MYLEFLTQNWFLFAMLAAILLLLVFDPGGSRAAGGTRKITAARLPQIQARESAVVVDVRSNEEFKKGHIEQSINLPLDTLADNLKKLNKYRGKPLILVCQAGMKAGKAAATLRKNEFTDLYMLDGGIGAWIKENMPLAK